jgi:ubiquinone/menaquinone biosynthesis C-methylase UbiE
LPYEDASFDVVTGFNSFQYAARPEVVLAEPGASRGPAAACCC